MVDQPVATVTAYTTYCHCKPPLLDDDDVCTICLTQWVPATKEKS